MTNIVVIDRRLGEDVINYGASSHQLIQVDVSTPMPELMRRIKAVVDTPRDKIGMLIIAAHGYAYKSTNGKSYDGFGMQLCAEDLDMQSVHFFRALDGLFESPELGITLLGCGVAAQERVATTEGVKMGFGERLCKAIAAGAATGVMASTSVQDISQGHLTQRIRGQIKTMDVVDPGAWEGDVWIFRPDGSKTKATLK